MTYVLILILNLLILGIWYRYKRKRGKKLSWYAGWVLPSDIFVVLGILVIGIFGIALFFTDNFPLGQKRTDKEMTEIKMSIKKFKKDTEKFPYSIEELIGKNPLRKNWSEDNWGTAYKFSKNENQSIELTSAGSDRQFGTKDDLKIEIKN